MGTGESDKKTWKILVGSRSRKAFLIEILVNYHV